MFESRSARRGWAVLGGPARRRTLVAWAATAVLAVVTGVAVASVVGAAEAALDGYGERVSVWVVTDDVGAGDPLDGRVVRRELPAGVVPAGAADGIRPGSRARVGLYAGEVVLAARVGDAGGSAVAARLPDDHVGVAVPLTSAVPPVEPGDTVDLVALGDSLGSSRPLASGSAVVAVTDSAVVVAVPRGDVAAVGRAVVGAGVVVAVTPVVAPGAGDWAPVVPPAPPGRLDGLLGA